MRTDWVLENEMIRITYNLQDNAGSDTDVPGGDTLQIVLQRYNDGSQDIYVYLTAPQVTRTSLGNYQLEVPTGSGVLVSGTNQNQFAYEWQVDGSVTDRERGEFVVVADL